MDIKTHNEPQVQSIKKRLLWISLFIILGIIIFLLFAYQTFTSSLENERKYQTKNLSASAIGIIQYFHNLELKGELSSSSAKKYAMQALESATYGKNGYFWINSGNGVLLMQPFTPKRVGVNQINWTDVNGKQIFRKFIDTAKSGGGWVSYSWPKPNTKGEYPKISYVDYIEYWDWVLGTGVYLDDMKESILWIIVKTSGVLFFGFLIFVIGGIASINFFANKLEELSLKDALTNLYTKRFLYEAIPDIQQKSLRLKELSLVVIFLDIDYFKKVNDTYGHWMGDQVLQTLGKIVSQETKIDDYCIRYGGEEIIVIGFYPNLEDSIKVAQKIRISFSEQSFVFKELDFHVTLSAGIAVYDAKKETLKETLERVDKKLYQSKVAGRNRVSF